MFASCLRAPSRAPPAASLPAGRAGPVTSAVKSLLHPEIGGAFLLERERAFLRVVREEHLDADLGIDLERVVLVQAFGLVDRPQDRLHRERSVVIDYLGDLEGLLQRRAVRHDVADETHLLGLGGRDVPAGQQQIAGHGVGDLTDQPHRRAAHRVQAPFGFGDAELGALACDADVGALQDLGAARDGRSLNRRDQWLGQPTALEQRVDARRVVTAVLEGVARRLGRRRLEVHARAEVAAGPGEDAAADLRIVVDAVPGLDHGREHLGGERVARLSTVRRQDQRVSALLNDGVGTSRDTSVRLAHGYPPSSVDAADLNENVTRSSLGSVALNIADLAEHAIDAVPDRVALICGDDQLTYAQLEEKANRLAHYLIDQGVKKDDKVGLYCRNRIEIVIAMLGIVKAGAILVNVNYRYVEGELRYLFDNSDMVALVHERQYSDRVANVLPETPNVKTILVVDDGSDVPESTYQSYGGAEFYAAIAESSPERDFGERSADDIYLLYTGGTTGFPKGVMWRHEDIYRVLFGGTDFATGEFVKDEYDLAKGAAASPPMIRHPIPPMIHGATQSATWMSIFSGQTTVLAPEFNADQVWRTIHEHKVNLLFFTGDAMARPLLDALMKENDYDLSSLFLLASTAALFSPSIKEKLLELLPNRVITDSIGSSETGFGGTSVVAKDAPHSGGPRVTIDHR